MSARSKERTGLTRRELLTGCFSSEPKEAEDLLKEYQYPLHGVQVDFLSLSHVQDTLDHHGALIDQRIKESDAVVLEGTSFDAIGEEFSKRLGFDEFSFISEIEQRAEKAEKTLIRVDPETIEYAVARGFLSTLPVSLVSSQASIEFYRSIKEGEIRNPLENKITRRKLIAAGVVAGIDSYFSFNLSPYTLPPRILLRGVEGLHEIQSTYGWDDKWINDSINYRNIRAGQNLNRLCKEYAADLGIQKLVVFYGSIHAELIIEYSKGGHEVEMQRKRIPLAIHSLLGDDSIRLFEFDKELQKWSKSPEIK